MHMGESQDSVREHLREALSTTDVAEKNYHVRQAIQLLQVEE